MKFDPNEDELIFESTGRREYANCGVIGIDAALDTTGGFDQAFPLGSSGRPLSTLERVELAEHMIAAWQRYKNRRTVLDLIKPGSPFHYYGSASKILGSEVTLLQAWEGVAGGTKIKVTDINLEPGNYGITAVHEGRTLLFPASYLAVDPYGTDPQS